MGSGCIDPRILDLGPGPFTFGEGAPGTHWIGGWVGPRTGLDNVERITILPLPGLELRTLGHPARNQSLYRLRDAGSKIIITIKICMTINRRGYSTKVGFNDDVLWYQARVVLISFFIITKQYYIE
jgi:hypothetical protein